MLGPKLLRYQAPQSPPAAIVGVLVTVSYISQALGTRCTRIASCCINGSAPHVGQYRRTENGLKLADSADGAGGYT